MSKRTYYSCVLIVLALFLVAGCGKGYVPLGGRVTFADNGEPLETGVVCLTNGAVLARGTIQKDGKFQVGFFKQTDGLPPGKYQVYIGGAEAVVGTRPVDQEYSENIYAPLIAAKHTRPETSGWEFDIDTSTRVLDLQVDRPASSDRRRQ